jgi:hypothetical protein
VTSTAASRLWAQQRFRSTARQRSTFCASDLGRLRETHQPERHRLRAELLRFECPDLDAVKGGREVSAISATCSLVTVSGTSFSSDSKTYSSVPPSLAAPRGYSLFSPGSNTVMQSVPCAEISISMEPPKSIETSHPSARNGELGWSSIACTSPGDRPDEALMTIRQADS